MQEPLERHAVRSPRKPIMVAERAHRLRALVRRIERAWPLSMVVMLVAMIGLWLLR